jgi:hypothetical protein
MDSSCVGASEASGLTRARRGGSLSWSEHLLDVSLAPTAVLDPARATFSQPVHAVLSAVGNALC